MSLRKLLTQSKYAFQLERVKNIKSLTEVRSSKTFLLCEGSVMCKNQKKTFKKLKVILRLIEEIHETIGRCMTDEEGKKTSQIVGLVEELRESIRKCRFSSSKND